MKKIFLNLVLLTASMLVITSCVKKANEWEIDPTHARLFKSLNFQQVSLSATTIEIAYSQTVSANKYVFEFSKDNLEFNTIVKTVEILADTLTPFASSNSPSNVIYRTMIDELDGNSQYSVRMKGIDTLSGLESNYSQFAFQTLAEQLFTNWEVYTDRIVMTWTPSDRVTHLSVFDAISGTEVQKNVLTVDQKQNGTLELKDLSPGTNYKVVIYNEEVERGVKLLKTSGLSGGVIIEVNPDDNISTLVSEAIANGKPNVTLIFKGGETYNLATLTLPAGLSNVSFTGEVTTDGVRPLLNIKELKLSDVIFGKVLMENVRLVGTNVDGDYFVNLTTNGLEIEEYSFVNCYMTTYRAAVRIANNSVKVKNITFDNSYIHRIGGYGVINIAGASPVVDLISFKNSTITDLSTQFMDIRSKVKSIVIGNCTFYNQNTALTQLFRFDTNNLPLSLTTQANIISGNNSGAKINATSYDHATSSLPVSFAGSYRTNELQIDRTSRDFSGIAIYPGSATDLFVDPVNRDFTIKPTANFGGRGTAGDPRWF